MHIIQRVIIIEKELWLITNASLKYKTEFIIKELNITLLA